MKVWSLLLLLTGSAFGVTVATPVCTPPTGTKFANGQIITCSTSTSSAKLCYTLDGSTPTATTPGTCSHGTTLTNGGTINITASETVNILGTLSGDTNSSVASPSYIVGGGVTSNIDDIVPTSSASPAIGWATPPYVDTGCGNPTGPTSYPHTVGNTSPSLDGFSSLFTLVSAPEGCVGWFYNAGPQDTNNTTIINDFEYQSGSTNSSGNANEFDVFLYEKAASNPTCLANNTDFYFGTQCVTSTGNLQIWDEGGTGWHYTSPTISCASAFAPGLGFHHVTMNDHWVCGDTSGTGGFPKQYYDSIVIDGTTHVINQAYSSNSMPFNYSENSGVNFELDVGSAGTTLTANLDEASLTFSSGSTIVYVSQNGGTANCGTVDGTQTGTISASAFNGGSQTPGFTYRLCGGITTPLTISSSGTSGNPITILFENNATLTCANATTYCLNLNEQTNIVVDGGIPCGPGTACSTSVNQYGAGLPATAGAIQQLTNGGGPGSTYCGAPWNPSLPTCGSFTSLSITNITCSAGTATVTGPRPFGLYLPSQPAVTISGNSVTAYNATVAVNSDNETAHQFTFTPSGGCGGTGTGGTVGFLCPSGSACSTQQAAVMINNVGCATEIRNLMIAPGYFRWSEQLLDGPTLQGIEVPNGCNSSNGVIIHDNSLPGNGIDYVGAGSGDNGLQMYNNYLVGTGDSIVMPGNSSGNKVTGAQIHNNYFADQATWERPDCSFHLDGIHLWSLTGSVQSGVNFYNNTMTGSMGDCPTGAIFFEGANQSDNFWNNAITITYTQNSNGIVGINGPGPFGVYNNTIYGTWQSGDLCLNIGSPSTAPSVTFKNNIVSGCHTIDEFTVYPSTLTADYDTYGCDANGTPCSGGASNWTIWLYDAGSSGCTTGGTGYCDLAQVQSLFSEENHSSWNYTANSMKLNSNGTLQSGSPAINGGTNLSSVATGLLASLSSDINGNPRGASWSTGAYNYSSSPTQAATPTFSPVAGSYFGAQSVVISSTSPGVVICYNTTGAPATNGSTGCTTGTVYSGAIAVSASETLYAVAGGTGYIDSTVGSAVYTITLVPTVTTTTAASITSISAIAGGTVTSNGGGAVTSEGTCYAVTANPTTPCTSDGTATPFTSNLTGLTPSTTYNYRAFATNAAGTSYGANLTFTTPSSTSYGTKLNNIILNSVKVVP